MIIAYVDDNQCDFAVKFRDKNRAIEVKKAITIGIDAWYSAANEEVEANEYWSKEYIEGFYDSGYAAISSLNKLVSKNVSSLFVSFNILYLQAPNILE